MYLFLNQTIWNNKVEDYFYFLLILLGILILIYILKKIIIIRLEIISKKTKNDYDDGVIHATSNISWWFYFVVGLYFAADYLYLANWIDKTLDYVFWIVFVWQIINFVGNVIDVFLSKAMEKKAAEEGPDSDVSKLRIFSKLIKIGLWMIGILLILSNLGYNITSLVAGLGIGGVAIALAVQNILSDIFASFSIYIDKPFEVGDFIIIGDKMGTVKKIGIKTTRVTSLQGEEIVFSNKELTTAQVQNFKKMQERRISFMVGATYGTPNEKLEKIPSMIKKTIESVDKCRFDRANWKDYGDFSLNYEIVYYINSADYNEYMAAQEKINLAIKEAFEKEKIEFAYPTQTIILDK